MSLSSKPVPQDALWNTDSPVHLQKHLFDVIVVGAGPAGSTAAKAFAKKGMSVLLLDKAHFPRTKACGDAVMYPALLELAQMGLLETMSKLFQPVTQIQLWQAQHALPPALIQQHAQSLPSLPVGGYVAPRDQFDTLLVKQAIASGASWQDQCTIERFLAVQQDRVLIQGRCLTRPVTLQARLLIIADGAGSRLGRQVRQMQIEQGIHTPLLAPVLSNTRFTAIRGYITGLKKLTDTLEFYFGQHPDLFYHWVFPTETETANVGVIATTQQWRKLAPLLSPQQALTAFLHTPVFHERASAWQWRKPPQAAPVCSGLHGESTLYGTRTLCVGESASLVDPQSAEGISGALVSGRIAAEIGTEALAHDRLALSDLAPYGEAIRTHYQAHYTAILQAMQQQAIE